VVIYYLWATDHISPDFDILSNNKVKVAVTTTFTVISLLICLAMPVFWIITKQKQPDHRLKKKIAELMATNKKLQQEVPNHRLKKKIAELTTINKKLQQEVEGLKREQIEILEDIIEVEPPAKNIPGFNPQEMKALAELAKRLR
jgi:septal ring factor EnvC (AmiA/AmiB activator)